MKLRYKLIFTVLVLCLIGMSYAAAEDSTASRSGPRDWGSDGNNTKQITTGQAVQKISQLDNVNAKSKGGGSKAKRLTTEASFTSIMTTGNSVDNTKKVAVYMPAITTHMRFGSTLEHGTVNVTYDPLVTAMLFEYNPTYIGDSADSLATLTPANYEVLIVPMLQMSDSAAAAINTYISNGGSVWFLNDPCLTPTGATNPNRINILDLGDSISTSQSTTITVVNNDSITRGLPASFHPVGTASKTNEFRLMSGSGTISGMNYQVLMSTGNDAMLIKYENPTNGARVIYSNPNMFISGGTSSYFDARTATQLFLQTKAWVMKLADNPNGVQITYPKSDKQFIVTVDDVEAASWERNRFDGTIFKVERDAGVNPSEVNTFFILPSIYTIKSEMDYYAQNGDTHTLHPHVNVNTYNNYLWSWVNRSVEEYQATINEDQSLINNRMGTTNYGFTSIRFPGTTFCDNSMKAFANTGYKIDASSGQGCMGTYIGNSQDNTALFPKQLLIDNTKTNMIEMELPAYFDIDYDTANEFYNGYNAVTPRLKYGNFPMNFVVGAHVIGAGSKADTATALGQIIDAAKAANPAYSNFNTLSNYINGVKSATITASVSGSTTTVQVVNSQPITDFTMKVAIGNVTSATCDGVAIPSSQIKQDALISSWYVTQTINAGTHVFVINGGTPAQPPIANFSANPISGNAPLAVQFTDTSTGSPTSWSWDFNGDGVADSNTQSPLYTYTAPGTYTASLTVSNGNGASSKSMTISVNQTTPGPGGSNANLTSLIINSGTLTPAFSPETTSYTYNMSIVVTPTAEDSNANITVNGMSVASGQALPISLNMGQNTVNIVVTAQNGATKTYTVTVNR